MKSVVMVFAAVVLSAVSATTAGAQDKPFEPTVGQPGKDVVWVPTPPALVDRMMELAKVTPQDFVMDLGSGDGRNIIAAAKRGANAVGVEYNPEMVKLSQRLAAEAGVSDKARFVEGDMFVADISKASVMALFLLPSNMLQLRDKFLNLRPGSRIVSNTFGIEGWTPDETSTVGGDCSAWCNALLWIVPAKVEGTWQMPQGVLTLKQDYQMVSGTLGTTPIGNGKLRGETFTFTAGGNEYTAKVTGNRMEGTMKSGAASTPWTATKN
jgi:SAM-dependent methyltransferase